MRRTAFRSIRTKLLAAFLTLAIIAAGVGGVAWISLSRIDDAQQRMTAQAMPAADALHQLELDLVSMTSAARRDAIDVAVNQRLAEQGLPGNPYLGEATSAAIQDVRASLERVAETLDGDQPLLDDVTTRTEEALAAADTLVNDGVADGDQDAINRQLEDLEARQDLALSPIRELGTLQDATLADADDSVASAIGNGATTTLILALVAVGTAIALGALYSRRITRPILDLRSAAVELGRGNFDARVQATGQDELGVLGRAFNQMADDLTRSTVSRDYIDNIIRSMPDSLVVVDRQGRIETVNDTTLHMLDYGPGDLIGQPVSTIMGAPLNGNGHRNEWLDQLSHEGAVANIERAYIRGDQSQVPVLFSASILRNGSNRVDGIICVAQDITDRKEAEARLLEARNIVATSEERLRAIIEASLDANITINPDGAVTGWNSAAERTFGYPASEAIGRTLSELIVPEHLREQHEAGIRRYLETREPHVIGTRIEITALHRDGHEFPVELTITEIETGSGPGFSAFIRDISDRKEAERQLQEASDAARESQEQLETILESSPDLIVSTGMDARIIFANSASSLLLGYAPDDMVGKLVYDLVHMEDMPRVLDVFANPAANAGASVEVRLRHADGAWHWFESGFRFFYDDDGNPFGAVIICRDITERKRSEEYLRQTTEELRRSNEELSQFAYVASHDLQEPLRMVSSYTRLLARRYEDQLDGNAHEYIHYAVDGVTRMQKLIDDLLTYSRVGTRGRPTDTADISNVVESATEHLRPTIEDTGAQITVDSELPQVVGDATQLTQVFQNLINNALKYRDPEVTPQVRIAARRKEDEWVFSVRDNGIGIDPRYQEKVFALFQRLHGRDEYEGGTGIGLAICRKIIERHGGRIWVESAAGKGATFYFTIADPGEEETADA